MSSKMTTTRPLRLFRLLALLAVITGISFTIVTNQRLSQSLYYYNTLSSADFSLPTWDTAETPPREDNLRKKNNDNALPVDEGKHERVREATQNDAVAGNGRHLTKSGGGKCTPRPQHIQKIVNSRIEEGKHPLIYLHDARLEQIYFPNGSKQACFKCNFTTDKSRSTEADVVVVLGDTNLAGNIPRKYCGQLFVLLTTSTPNKGPQSPKEMFEMTRGIFDATSSYRLDSDLPRPYHQDVIEMMADTTNNYVPVNKRDSEAPVAWIANNCESTNHRTEYVKELMNHIGVKSYGDCLKNAKFPNGPESANSHVARHKFYLSFEDSNCDYHVTEQLYRPLELGVIPIIMGAPQANLYVPNNHSALFVNDYESPKALAKRIQEINKNDKLFQHYTAHVHDPTAVDTAFRGRWMRKRPAHACQLCNIIKRSYGANLRGIVKEDWEACEEQQGTWKTNFQTAQG